MARPGTRKEEFLGLACATGFAGVGFCGFGWTGRLACAAVFAGSLWMLTYISCRAGDPIAAPVGFAVFLFLVGLIPLVTGIRRAIHPDRTLGGGELIAAAAIGSIAGGVALAALLGHARHPQSLPQFPSAPDDDGDPRRPASRLHRYSANSQSTHPPRQGAASFFAPSKSSSTLRARPRARRATSHFGSNSNARLKIRSAPR